ncbi:MAG: Bug family tripartite tricarboxylate transporter substrate binding protein, partial [Polaromonas sp.]
LAVTSAKRLESLPNVPTVAESGVPGFEVVSWQGIFVPAGTPRPIIEQLHNEIRKILQQPEMQERLKTLGMQPSAMTTDQVAAFQKTEVEKWAQVIKAANVKLE